MDRGIRGKDFGLGFLFLFILSGTGYAEMVSYYDDQGQIHYVNPDYGTVPAKYRDQIKSKSKAPDQDVKADKAVSESAPAKTDPVSPAGTVPLSVKGDGVNVIVLANGPLLPTDNLIWHLNYNKISYSFYDINTEPGKTIYRDLGSGTLPIVHVMTSLVVQGAKVEDVIKAVNLGKSCYQTK